MRLYYPNGDAIDAATPLPHALYDASGNAIVAQQGNADDQPATDRGLVVNSRLYLFDGTNWDRAKAKANGWPGFALLRSSDGTELGMTNGATDGLSTGYYAAHANAQNLLYNGASWDRQRGNTEGVLLASAARTVGATSPTQTNHNARGVVLFMSVSAVAVPGTTLFIRVRAYNPTGGAGSWTLAQTNNIVVAAGGRYGILYYPGVAVVASSSDAVNAQASGALPRTWFADVTPSDANSVTYDLGYSLIV